MHTKDSGFRIQDSVDDRPIVAFEPSRQSPSPGPSVLGPLLFGRAMIALAFALFVSQAIAGDPPSKTPGDPFTKFDLPDAWEARFWGSPDAVALLELDPKRLADLVPTQAGFRFCRCPSCETTEADNTLAWSIRKPKVITCKHCNESFPNEKIPAQADKKVPEDTIEVAPGLTHHYPYHAVEADKQRRLDERLYLNAKRDYEAREYLAKAALYAAIRHREQPLGRPDPTLARVACVLILRFAQVYPNYALHLDQPGQPKFLEPANQAPPYRRGYGTGKWDWSGSLDVPLNLLIAYALVRDDPEMAKAGKLLHDPDPKRTIEHDLFRASARFVLDQPEELNEQALQVDRGVLAVARLLSDPPLGREATNRLRDFSEQGFTHDGLWQEGDAPSHRRVLAMLDGWIERLLIESPVSKPPNEVLPMLGLARSAGSAILAEAPVAEVQQVGWPIVDSSSQKRHPGLLGGAGVARLAVGKGADAFDLELRGMAHSGSPRSRRQALRLAVGGRMVLGDLDDLPTRHDGWDRASASHNTVLVDGLNQRETPRLMREAAAGGDFLYFAADPDFQVAVLDDPWSYPKSTTRYRQTVVACSGPKTRYAVTVFEVVGGLQHDQFFHANPGNKARWTVSVPTTPGPESLLPPTIPYLANAQADDGRWFVQGYGELARMAHGLATVPALATLGEPDKPGVRIHLLGDAPFSLVTGSTPRSPSADDPERSMLLVRRSSNDGSTLASTFVTVFDPIGPNPGLTKVGRMTSTPGFVVLYLETLDGSEHLVINLKPGLTRTVQLADGRDLTTDAFVVRTRRDELMMAGGTVANASGVAVRQPALGGTILAAVRYNGPDGRGWFETEAPIATDPALTGRTLSIRHGDGTSRAWTLTRIETTAGNRVRLYVREEPGFLIEGNDRTAHYYQFPGTISRGPHTFTIATIRR
jgi:hypothetical protein